VTPPVAWVAKVSTRLERGLGASVQGGATALEFFNICGFVYSPMRGGGVDAAGAWSQDRSGRWDTVSGHVCVGCNGLGVGVAALKAAIFI
jgi:hypothetical protein